MYCIEKLEQDLFEMQDLKYREFHSRLMPGIDKETIIGIRMPVLRKFTREFAKTPEAECFLRDLPHRYYEENNMHMMIVSWIKDYGMCLAELVTFLHRNVLRSTKKNCFRKSEDGSHQRKLIRSAMESVC